jgi:hypothetical protein
MFDGSYSPETHRMGASFIAHHHHLGSTHVNSKGYTQHDDNSSMLAEATAFDQLLCNALASNSKGCGLDPTTTSEERIFLETVFFVQPLGPKLLGIGRKFICYNFAAIKFFVMQTGANTSQ